MSGLLDLFLNIVSDFVFPSVTVVITVSHPAFNVNPETLQCLASSTENMTHLLDKAVSGAILAVKLLPMTSPYRFHEFHDSRFVADLNLFIFSWP